MSFNRYDPRTRYRTRSQQRLGAGLGLIMIGLIGLGAGWGLGYQGARVQIASLKADIAALTSERDSLRATATRLMADTHSSSLKYQQIEEKLQAELPDDGQMRDIITQIKEQLGAGVSPDRLASVVRTLSPPRNCTDPEVKRLVVQTPKNQGGGVGGSLADGAITLRVAGVSAKNAKGGDEAWFDPGQPVTVTFDWQDTAGAQTRERHESLPFSQVITGKGKEYRLTFSAGARSFVKVTYDRCDYP